MQNLLINTPDALAESLERWRPAPWLAVDTEFVREDTYFANLCLVQVSDGAHAACVDVLALDPKPLFDLLARKETLKVLHAAGQDLEIFVQHTGDCPRPVFDTQIAAALLGHGEQLGYAALVEAQLGVKLDKSLARTDWSRRPLPDAALRYAADDVHHLAVIYPRLRGELERRGRLAWLEEEAARLTRAERYKPAPATAWHNVKGLSRLAPPAQQRAAKLAAWREEEALRRNRPRRWILDDEWICLLANRQPDSVDALKSLDGFPPKLLARAGEALVALLREPVPDTPVVTDGRFTSAQGKKVQDLLVALRAIAAKAEVMPTLVATRSDIEALVREGPDADVELVRGWRREVAGAELLKLL